MILIHLKLMEYAVYEQKPAGFTAQVEAAGGYLWCQNRLLLVRRHENKPQGGTWGIPAGKLEANESPKEAAIREVQEEVGVDISSNLESMGELYITLPDVSYIYHMFFKPLESFPELTIALEEHVEARWVSTDDALTLPLIKGAKEALIFFKKFLEKTHK